MEVLLAQTTGPAAAVLEDGMVWVVITVLLALMTLALGILSIFRPLASRSEVEKMEGRLCQDISRTNSRISAVEAKIDTKLEALSDQIRDTYTAIDRSGETRAVHLHTRLNVIGSQVDRLTGAFNTSQHLKKILAENDRKTAEVQGG